MAVLPDQLYPFMVNDAPVRGRVVRLDSVADAVLKRHDYPEPISRLLAEALVVAAMLASNLKSDGVLTLQLQSNGPLSLLVVDAAYGGGLRGYADFDAEKVAALDEPTLVSLCEKGHLVMTFDPGEGGARYQGVVELMGDSLAQAIGHYLSNSQQLQAQFYVSVGQQETLGSGSQWLAGGIYTEKMPDVEGEQADEDIWPRCQSLIGTVRDDELLDIALSPPDLLYRLFHEDGVWVYDPLTLKDQCRCSREKIEQFLRSMDEASRTEMAVDGQIEVDCQFCGNREVFSA